MPFKFEKITITQSEVHLLHYQPYDTNTYLSVLNKEEILRYSSFKSQKRKDEFLATRILKQELFGNTDILYTEIGAPYLKEIGHISISHCNNCVGIAANHDFKIGLDLESFRPNIMDLKHKFLSPTEIESFDTFSKDEVTRIWSAKESLYKLAGRKKIHFKKDLILQKDKDLLQGSINNYDHFIFATLASIEHGDMFVTINTLPIERKDK